MTVMRNSLKCADKNGNSGTAVAPDRPLLIIDIIISIHSTWLQALVLRLFLRNNCRYITIKHLDTVNTRRSCWQAVIEIKPCRIHVNVRFWRMLGSTTGSTRNYCNARRVYFVLSFFLIKFGSWLRHTFSFYPFTGKHPGKTEDVAHFTQNPQLLRT